MYIRLGEVEIREPNVQMVAGPFLGGQFEFSGKVLGDTGRDICVKLRVFKKGDKRNFEVENDKGKRVSGVAEIKDIEISDEPADGDTLWKYRFVCEQI